VGAVAQGDGRLTGEHICHLAANAVQEVYDLSALGLIRAFVEAHP
jgi:hypothetical protein